MTINFHKPTHITDGRAWINLRLEKVEQAAKNKEMIEVILPQGKCHPVDPKLILSEGKKTEAIFKRPNEPMKLIGYYFQIKTKDEIWQDFSKFTLS